MHSIPIAEEDAPPALDEPAIDLSADLRGRVLMGRYELSELFFHGELGSVYLGHDQHSGRPVEVKILAASAAGSGLVERFRERSRRMIGLSHVGLAAVYGEGLTENGLAFAITEHRAARNFHHMYGDPRLAWPAPEAITRQLAEALQALHAVGVVHGAVSPGNIVWVEDGARPTQVQLVDREFHVPVVDAGEPDPRTDLYALGALIHEFCTGRVHDDAQAPAGMRGADAQIAVPAPFESVILALIDRDPDARPASAMALLDLLDRAHAASGMDAGDLDFLAALEEPGGVPSRFQPVEPSRPMPVLHAQPEAPSRPAPAAPEAPAASQPAPEPAPQAASEPPKQNTLAELREVAERDAAAAGQSAAPAQPVLFALEPLGERKPTFPPTPAATITAASVATTPASAVTPASTATAPSAVTPASTATTPSAVTTASTATTPSAVTLASTATTAATPASAVPPAAAGLEPAAKLEPATKPALTPAVAPTSVAAGAAARPARKATARRRQSDRRPMILALLGAVIAIGLLIWLIQSCRSDAGDTGEPRPPAAPVVAPAPAQPTPVQPTPPAQPEQPVTSPPAELPATPEPTPASPEPTPTPTATDTPEPTTDPATPTELPEQLSASEFRRVMLRANRTTAVRTCYRRHARPGEEEVTVIGTVSPAGKIQKLRTEPAIPLGECLKPLVLKIEFPPAARSAQHNFIFRNLFPGEPG